jgi:hypothetical protein
MHLISFALGQVVLIFLAHTAGGLRVPLIERLQLITCDSRLRPASGGGVDKRIVIVDSDAKSPVADAC